MVTVDEFLDFFIDTYIYCFILCFLGSLMKDLYSKIKNVSKLSIIRIFISTVFSSLLSAAISDPLIKRGWHFSVLLFLFLLLGMFGFWIFEFINSYGNMYRLAKNVSSKFGKVGKAVSDTLKEVEDENIEIHNEENTKPNRKRSKKKE